MSGRNPTSAQTAVLTNSSLTRPFHAHLASGCNCERMLSFTSQIRHAYSTSTELSMNKLLVFISVCCLVHGSSRSYASDGDGLVPSWNDFYEYHRSSNCFGTFQTKGVTQGMWAGIEAGQQYTATYTLEPAEGGKTGP